MPNPAAALNIQRYSYESIQKGSLSFSFASRVFSPVIRNRVVKLYAWCRFVDDQIDNEHMEVELRKWRLQKIAEQSFGQRAEGQLPIALHAFRELRAEIDFPKSYPEDLLAGMKMDLDREVYQTMSELEVYCYRVAGVVGLMMTRVMGVKDERALKHALDLGLAMQLTNISRDILTDARMGRIYLPQAWLRDEGIPIDPNAFEDRDIKKRLVPMVKKLLTRAEHLYKSGDKGLHRRHYRTTKGR